MTQTYPIRAISADEFGALADVDAHAFLDPWPAEAVDRERITAEFDRTFAALDGDQMVASGANLSFQLTVPGAVAPAAGITSIAVLPSHRRRGILTAMMNRLISDAADRSEPVAILFASEAGIYGRFGFGLATMSLDLTIRRGDGPLSSRRRHHGRRHHGRRHHERRARRRRARAGPVACARAGGCAGRAGKGIRRRARAPARHGRPG